MIKVYLFDLDDTLIDTKIYAKLYPKILPIIEKETGLKGSKLDQKARQLKLKENKAGRWDSGDLCRELGLLDQYYPELEKLIKVVPVLHNRVRFVFNQLRVKKRRIGIVSNSMRKTIKIYLKKYGLKVDFVFSQDDAGCRKDQNNYWKKLIKKEKLNPEECLVIGDDKIEDVKIPLKFGFQTYHLKKPARLKEILALK